MNTIKLDRDEGKVFLKADSEGLLIVSSGGWSVPIDPEIANNYIKNYDRNDNHKNNINYGFYSNYCWLDIFWMVVKRKITRS